MIYSIYDPITGIVMSRVRDPRQILDRPYVDGNWTPGQYYVRDGQAYLLPSKPAAQNQVRWLWDKASESWIYDAEATKIAARDIRQNLFANVDRVNPMWWAAMTPEQQAATAAYRQALLDITDQPGYPEVIDWPLKPAWL